MQFESKTKRTLVINAALGFIPDVVIAVALAVIFDGGVMGAVLTFLAIQVLYLIFWIKKSIWAWVMFKTRGRATAASALHDYFKENQFPEPDTYQRSVEHYLDDIVSDRDSAVELKIKAATLLSALNHPATYGQFQDQMRLTIAYEDALERYKTTLATQAVVQNRAA